MDVLAWMGDAAGVLLRVFLVIAPLLAWQWTFDLAQPWRAKAGPVWLTPAASILTGLTAFAAVLPHGALTWNGIVAPGGYWDLAMPEFLSRSARLAGEAVPALLDILRFDDHRRNFQVCLAVAAALWGLRLAAVLVIEPSRMGKAVFLAAESGCLAIGMFATIYTGSLVVWLVNRLNFCGIL